MDTWTQLQASIGDLELIGANYEAEIDRLNGNIKDRDDRIEDLEFELEDRDGRIKYLERELEEVQAELLVYKNVFEDKLNALQAELGL